MDKVGSALRFLASGGWAAEDPDVALDLLRQALPIRITPDDASNLTTAAGSVWVISQKHSSATRIDLNQAP